MEVNMKNIEIFQESKKYMPGGVNSPVRSYKDVEITPPIMKRGIGAYIYDEEDKRYVDFVGAWGPMILGHCDEDVVKAIKDTCEISIAFGAPTELELKLAKYMCTTLDNFQMVRMVNSGTEATMSAVRLARGYTKKDKVLKFAGCYHGHYEGFLVSAGSGVLTEGIPGSAGIPQENIKNTLVGQYNNIENIRENFSKYGEELAAVIIEPVAGNMGVVKAEDAFMEELRRLCDKYGTLLIFDEVMSGFRISYMGAQSLFKVKPDLVTYAKIMGGGLPCGAYGGRKEIMEKLSPLGAVYQAGTMSGNPVVMAAGLAALTKLHDNPKLYEHIEALGTKLKQGLETIAEEKSIPLVVNRCGGMMTMFFTERDKVSCYDDVMSCDTKLFKRFFTHMLNSGFNLPPSQYEAMFLSVKHSDGDIEEFLEAFRSFEY